MFKKILILTVLSSYSVGIIYAIGPTCYGCSGINCMRTSKNVTINCESYLDPCATIFQGDEVLERGCYSGIHPEIRKKCFDREGRSECMLCTGNLCNNLGKPDNLCIQCDSRKEPDCKNNISKFQPKTCPISVSMRSYCFAKVIGNDIVRGCAIEPRSQIQCYNDENCYLCLPGDLGSCNDISLIKDDGGQTTTESSSSSSSTTDSSGSSSSSTSSSTSSSSDTTTEGGVETTTEGGGGASSISLTVSVLAAAIFGHIVSRN